MENMYVQITNMFVEKERTSVLVERTHVASPAAMSEWVLCFCSLFLSYQIAASSVEQKKFDHFAQNELSVSFDFFFIKFVYTMTVVALGVLGFFFFF